MHKVYFGLTLFLGLIASSVAFAGAGANINACVYLAVAPAEPITFKFKAGGSVDHCMNATGEDSSITVSKAGVSCISVGYVEAKASSTGGDICETDTSTWILSYSSSSGGYSGSTQAHMSHPFLSSNHISLSDSSPKTFVCGSSNLCDSTKQIWDAGTIGPLYIIFQPGADI